jgi:hypothetical protein
VLTLPIKVNPWVVFVGLVGVVLLGVVGVLLLQTEGWPVQTQFGATKQEDEHP